MGLAVAALCAASAAGGWQARGVVAARDLAVVISQHTQQIAAMAEAALQAQQAARIEEARRAARHQEITDAAILQAEARLADARRAAATADRLRRAAQAFATSHRGAASDSAPAGQCQAADAAAIVLADLLADVEQRGREMARIADERGAAGAACQRAYESLTEGQQ